MSKSTNINKREDLQGIAVYVMSKGNPQQIDKGIEAIKALDKVLEDMKE